MSSQNRAVLNLKTYGEGSDFLAGATGLPKLAVRNDLLGHVLELKISSTRTRAGTTRGRRHLPPVPMFMTTTCSPARSPGRRA